MSIFNGNGQEITIGNSKEGILNIFKKIGFVGDSLSAGYVSNGTSKTDFDMSWGALMCKRYDIVCANYARAGIATKTWLESDLKTTLENDTKCDAYFIALCTNDYGEDYPTGEASDAVGSNSFCGYFKQIIQTIRTKNPNATIFCLSQYSKSNSMSSFGAKISAICDLYDYCFYVDFINNSEETMGYGGHSTHVSAGHYTNLGYFFVSKDIEMLVNNIISDDDNKTYFEALPFEN